MTVFVYKEGLTKYVNFQAAVASVAASVATISASMCCPGATREIHDFGNEDDESNTGDGNFSPDASNIDIGTLHLRAERIGGGHGRTGFIPVPFFFKILGSGERTNRRTKVVLCGSVSSNHFSSAGFHITRANFHEPSFCFSSTRRSFPRRLLTGEVGDSR